jgi:hypothetical protein
VQLKCEKWRSPHAGANYIILYYIISYHIVPQGGPCALNAQQGKIELQHAIMDLIIQFMQSFPLFFFFGQTFSLLPPMGSQQQPK